MNGGQLLTNQLRDINWGALDHASRAPQLVTTIIIFVVCLRVQGLKVGFKARQTEFTVYRHKVFDFACGRAVNIQISN